VPTTPPRGNVTRRRSNSDQTYGETTSAAKGERDLLRPRSQSNRRLPRSPLGRLRSETKVKAKRSEQYSQRRAMSTMYREMLLMNNFSVLNYTGVIKITKKAKKTLERVQEAAAVASVEAGQGFKVSDGNRPSLKKMTAAWMEQHDLNEGNQVQAQLRRVEKLYANMFSDGNVHVSIGELTSSVSEETISYDLLKLGYRLGMGATFGLWMLWDCIIQGLKHGGPNFEEMPGFPAFCALGGLLFIHWSWAIQVGIWTRYKINYIYLFELDPRHIRSHLKIVNDCCQDTIMFIVLVLLYYKSELRHLPVPRVPSHEFRPGVFLILGFTIAAYRLVTPWNERKGLWEAIFNIIRAPMRPVSFFDTYVGDVMTSMVKVFVDLAYAAGFIASGDALLVAGKRPTSTWQASHTYRSVILPLVVFLPLFWRFLQCLARFRSTDQRWPHLGNASKYGAAMLVTVFGALHPLYTTLAATLGYQMFWYSLFIFSSCLSFWWDVVMDWGLGKLKYGLLNDRMMFPRKWYYYSAMVLDFLLRFLWVYTLVPPDRDMDVAMASFIHWLAPVSLLLEMVRRTVWGFFRLENEHLRNTEGFRRVSVVPLHFDRKRDVKMGPERESKFILMEMLGFGFLIIGVGAVALVMSSIKIHDMKIEKLLNSSHYDDDDME